MRAMESAAPVGRVSRELVRSLLVVGLVASAACGGDEAPATVATPAETGAAGVPGLAPGSTPVVPNVAGSEASAGTTAPASMPAAGALGIGPAMMAGAAAPTAGSEAHGHATPAGPGEGATMAPAGKQCRLQVVADPRDEMLTDEPLEIDAGFEKDYLVPQIVLDWMDENEFAESHDGWHLVRKWDQSCRQSNATSGCSATRNLVSQGLERAPVQQGAPGDGLAFMMMHRHMFMMLHTAFPKHVKLFEGFKEVPRTTDHPENPVPGRQISWTSNNIQGFDILENIEQHLDMFPTEDDLGQYIENTYRWTPENPTSPVNEPGAGAHGALHSQWSVFGSPANLIEQAVDVKNFMFWKLHGWIDNVWERYRKAKGLKDTDADYQQLMFEQCEEMFLLQPRNRNMPPGSGPTTDGAAGSGPTVAETGFFAQQVRPFFDRTCGGCHSAIAPSAGMTLGGMNVSSADVVKGIVGIKSMNGEYDLIEPGAPERSWIYLKASGEAATAACAGACDREKMPPSGTGLSDAELGTLRQWIMNGATTN